ncbi:YveK family protein [Heyndrickxia sporothermodurans]|uniref:YveK family protein n=1 Tax=Heyndrickxia sporothermodurans TaxID=46224 RepID=UPI002E1D6058|nr:Wzz/FepE/Etk N-terminal domain-containing protein [Heyndrickxia sporothermodurans]MED3652380.1 Wzz/FepE/Etk N-terminal domain-containing protein [Heyndrickxia sporothermodurans]MED3696910.1 Wzz/FepE/Etk N-terminal domain-containing protein [Heyndrickxia sporothermodurans]MED3781077.1 Wzz/FepE/Etk N-terminal domain-containing protein [Heyndrickxia sporothermodurans]
MEETISLKELMQTLRKRIGLITVIAIIAVIISGVVSYFVLTPIYQTSTQLLVNQKKGEENPYNTNQVQTNLQLINTYNVIIKSPAILDKVVDELNLKMTAAELNEKVTVASEKDSQVVNVSVQDEDPYKAAKIANKIANVFKTNIASIMNVDNVSILTKAEVGEKISPIKPKPVLNIAIALVVGLMVGVGIAFLLEYLDNTIKTEQDIEKILEIPVLGVITTIEEHDEVNARQRAGNKVRVRGETVGSQK